MKLLILLFLLIPVSYIYTYGQLNMVSNGSFEQGSCPTGFSQLNFAQDWSSPSSGTPDLFDICSSFPVDVPRNAFGYQLPIDGNSYAGFIAFGFTNAQEYVQNRLIDSLVQGKKYFLSFYVNLSNFSKYSNTTLGALLTTDQINNAGGYVLPFVPQYQNNSISLMDTLNWIQLTDTFIAQGGEKYLTIGCFAPDSLCDTSSVSGQNNYSYYYIDNVSIIEDTATLVNDGIEIPKILVYPNPFNFELTLSVNVNNYSVEIYNTLGELVLSSKFESNKTQLDLSGFALGVYLLKISTLNFTYTQPIIKLY